MTRALPSEGVVLKTVREHSKNTERERKPAEIEIHTTSPLLTRVTKAQGFLSLGSFFQLAHAARACKNPDLHLLYPAVEFPTANS